MRLAAVSTTPLGRAACAVVGCLVVVACLGVAPSAWAKDASVRSADLQAILGEIRRPGARAVLVNVWASWCDPCRAEMPRLLRFFRRHGEAGLRLVLVSADDEADRDKAIRFLASQGVDFPTWIKKGDDMTFIDALDPQWSGALPASFLFDGKGRLVRRWYGEVTDDALKGAWDRLVPRPKGRTP